jgi:hypothetical protein
MEEAGAYVGAWAPAGKNASQPGGGLYADELSRTGTEVHGEPAAPRGHFEDAPPIDLEPCKDLRMDGLGLADGVPELRVELINHRPEQGSTQPLGRQFVAVRGRFPLTGWNRRQVLAWQPGNIIKAVAPPAGWSGGGSLEVIHF